MDGAGNVISANGGAGIPSWASARRLVEADFIGGPGGGYLFGSGDPGNGFDGVWIDGTPITDWRRCPRATAIRYLRTARRASITGVDAIANTVLNNTIGLTSGGTTALGNHLAGVYDDTAPGDRDRPGQCDLG